MKTNEKADLAIRLIERASNMVPELAQMLRDSQQPDESKFRRAMEVLESLENIISDRAPDADWWHEYFLLTSDHMHLTEEGWIPADQNTREVTGTEPMEVLCEVNAKGRGYIEAKYQEFQRLIESAASMGNYCELLTQMSSDINSELDRLDQEESEGGA